MTDLYKGLVHNQQIGVGAADVQDPKIESAETIASRIRKFAWLAPEQTIVTSSCGFNHLPRRLALGKLKAMSEAKRLLGG
jgi:5-methyltetrahydropteroyltriglutamate--homocysteine methyltransferase